MNILSIFGSLIKVAFILGTMGAIGEVTNYFMKNSADAFQNDRVSLGAWNRQLLNGNRAQGEKSKSQSDHGDRP